METKELTPFEEIAPSLSEQEQMFLYQLEVVGLPVIRAAEIAGVNSPYYLLKKAHIVAAREQYREAVRGRTDFTREDVVFGLKEAIDQAKVLADPMAQIAGWREISKLKGYDKAPSISINLHGTIDQMRRQIQALPTEELMRLAGENVLDADFYRVTDDAAK
jgi:hypothetical protein